MARSRRHRLGQNFLVDPRVSERIVDLLASDPARIVEIGPGQGALTSRLIGRFPRLVAIETDEALIDPLRTTFGNTPVEVIHADALKFDFEALLTSEAPWQLAANLPYSVGTSIVRRLLPCHKLFSRMVVMLQREMVERLVAEPGDREHGLLALERAAFAHARTAFDVPAEAFKPRPKVESQVVVLEPFECPHDRDVLAGALKLASHALTRRRKVLANAIKPLVTGEDIEMAGLRPDARPGTLALSDWLRLARSVRSSC
ncbi:MAG: ribosomal RNA small subunit methyltransferase A [bacterium]|nr:ribosomal RNA small subunit methyltransferase A [bacterium]